LSAPCSAFLFWEGENGGHSKPVHCQSATGLYQAYISRGFLNRDLMTINQRNAHIRSERAYRQPMHLCCLLKRFGIGLSVWVVKSILPRWPKSTIGIRLELLRAAITTAYAWADLLRAGQELEKRQ
jgi:hypothetical protein